MAETSQAAADAFYPAQAEVMNRIGRERGWPPTSRAQFDASRAPKGALFVGSPAEVTDKILANHAIFGFDRFLIQMAIGVIDHADADEGDRGLRDEGGARGAQGGRGGSRGHGDRGAVRTSLSPAAAAALVPDGAVVMIGGFMGVGTPHRVIRALVERGVRGLTVIANDTARPGVGIGLLISAGCVAKAIVSHIGTNPETQARMIAGEIEVELVPQGTLVERIRAAGAGLGGVLTPTGVGTLAAVGKQTLELNGREYLLEPALPGDVALVAARSADYMGNLVYSLTARNFNPLMAMAAACVIAEPNEIVPVGVLPPDAIHTPGVVVDHVIERLQPA